MRVEGHPQVGDVYEQKYGPAKGKRVQLTQFHDAPAHLNRWFSTQTVAHPASPQMVGSTGSAGVQALTDHWRLVTQEASAGLVLDTLILLPRVSSSGLRKIADEAQRIIDARMVDGIPE